jgi:hypothetical protein
LKTVIIWIFHMGRLGKGLHPEPAATETGGVIAAVILKNIKVVEACQSPT